MKFKEIIKKIKEYDYKKLLNTKAFLIVGCVALVGVALLISTLVNKSSPENTGNESGKYLGNPTLVDQNTSGNAEEEGSPTGAEQSFFALTVINRQRVREEAMEVLQELADNPDAMPDTKEEALAGIQSITNDMNAEINIETLIKAKGFEECVAVISGKKCNIVVKSEGLLAAEVAQIVEIVYIQSGILPADVYLIEK